MKEPTYLRDGYGPIPLSACTPVELMEVANGRCDFSVEDGIGPADEGIGRIYAGRLLRERLG